MSLLRSLAGLASALSRGAAQIETAAGRVLAPTRLTALSGWAPPPASAAAAAAGAAAFSSSAAAAALALAPALCRSGISRAAAAAAAARTAAPAVPASACCWAAASLRQVRVRTTAAHLKVKFAGGKIKPYSAYKQRFKTTGSGKVVYARPGHVHKRFSKSKRQLFDLGGPLQEVRPRYAKAMKKLGFKLRQLS